MKSYLLTEKEKEYIRLYSEKLTITDISKNLKRSWKTIYNYIKTSKLTTLSKKTKEYVKINNISFTQKEFEVLRLIVKGYSTQKICKTLFIAYPTFATHWENIRLNIGLEKKDFDNEMSVIRVQAVLWYLKNVKHIDLESEN